MMMLLVIFGGAIVAGDLIRALRFEAVVAAIFISRSMARFMTPPVT